MNQKHCGWRLCLAPNDRLDIGKCQIIRNHKKEFILAMYFSASSLDQASSGAMGLTGFRLPFWPHLPSIEARKFWG